MKKRINIGTESAALQRPLKYWRMVKASDESFIDTLSRIGAARYSIQTDLQFKEQDILLLENNGKGIFVWKQNVRTDCNFTCTIFLSRSQRSRVELLKSAIRAVQNIYPTAKLDVKLGSELICIVTDKILIEAGLFT